VIQVQTLRYILSAILSLKDLVITAVWLSGSVTSRTSVLHAVRLNDGLEIIQAEAVLLQDIVHFLFRFVVKCCCATCNPRQCCITSNSLDTGNLYISHGTQLHVNQHQPTATGLLLKTFLNENQIFGNNLSHLFKAYIKC
jgi:hypothetical protein